MAYTTIDKPTDYFETKLYTGNGGTNNITGLDFQPDWVWIKRRTAADHKFTDSVRGTTKVLECNSTAAESTDSNGLTAFNSDGFTVGSSASFNSNTVGFASWNWKKQAGVFDIVTYTGNGSNRTISHNLGAVPTMMIIKNYESSGTNWFVYHVGIGDASKYIKLNQTNAVSTKASLFNSTAPTSSVFSLGTDNDGNENNQDFICYLFGNKQGVSKMGSYTGNGNANGTFVFCGFKPAFVLLKYSNASGNNWFLYDNKRPGYNEIDQKLYANASDAEEDSQYNNMDFLSNGFKLRTTDGDSNASGGIYIFMAFAENPFVTSSGVPTTAR